MNKKTYREHVKNSCKTLNCFKEHCYKQYFPRCVPLKQTEKFKGIQIHQKEHKELHVIGAARIPSLNNVESSRGLQVFCCFISAFLTGICLWLSEFVRLDSNKGRYWVIEGRRFIFLNNHCCLNPKVQNSFSQSDYVFHFSLIIISVQFSKSKKGFVYITRLVQNNTQ